MKRNLIVTITVALLVLPAVALAANSDRFIISDAVAVDGITDQEIIVPISIDNSQDLIALDIPLSYTEGAVLDKVEFTDRVKDFDLKIAQIDNEKNQVLIGFISLTKKDNPELTTGTGVIANLHFTIEKALDQVDVEPIYIDDPNHFLAFYYNDWSTGRPELKTIDPEVVKGSGTVSQGLPLKYELLQNSPNPFNPVTGIKFATTQPGHVKLNVYNVLGQKVRTLVDEYLDADVHEVVWDSKDEGGHSVASGVYFYRIDTDNFSQTRKMVLLK